MPKQPKTTPKHPSYSDMVEEAIGVIAKPLKGAKGQRGASRASIVKYVEATYGLERLRKTPFRLALKRLVTRGVLTPVKDSYLLSKSAQKKPKVTRATKPKAKVVQKPVSRH